MTERPTLLDMFTPVILQVLDLSETLSRPSGEVASAREVLDDLQARLDAIVTAAERAGKTRQWAEQSRDAVVAWIDEVIQRYRSWLGDEVNLQTRLYGRLVLGQAFFEVLSNLDKDRESEVVEVYFTCLALGFRGVMAVRDGPAAGEIDRLKNDCGRHLTVPAVVIDRLPRDFIFEQPYRMPDPPEADPVMLGSSGWLKWVVMAAVAALLLIGAAVWWFWPAPEIDWRQRIQTAAEGVVGQFECAELSVRTGADLTVRYDGFLRSEDDRQKLLRELGAIERVHAVIGSVDVFPTPLCDVLVILKDTRRGDTQDPNTPVMTLNHPDGRYRKGELVSADVGVSSAKPGHLEVAYIGRDGRIIHLFPNADETSSAVPAGAVLKLGYAPDHPDRPGVKYFLQTRAGYRATAVPPGASLLFALWSEQRLFAERRPEIEEEPAGLLSALRKVVADRKAGNGTAAIFSQYMVLDEQP